jgi:hypothetical protein
MPYSFCPPQIYYLIIFGDALIVQLLQCFWYFSLVPDILYSMYFFSYVLLVHKTVCNHETVQIKLYDENKMNYLQSFLVS